MPFPAFPYSSRQCNVLSYLWKLCPPHLAKRSAPHSLEFHWWASLLREVQLRWEITWSQASATQCCSLESFHTSSAGIEVPIRHTTWLDVDYVLVSKVPSRSPKAPSWFVTSSARVLIALVSSLNWGFPGSILGLPGWAAIWPQALEELREQITLSVAVVADDWASDFRCSHNFPQ